MIVHESYTVGTTPTLIAEIPAGNPATNVDIINDDNSSIYVGDLTVATSGQHKGLTVIKNSVYHIELHAKDKLYAVSAAGTAAYSVSVLYSKVLP